MMIGQITSMHYTVRTFTKKMRYRRDHWENLIDTIFDKGLKNEKLSNKWFVKDILCHITRYDEEILKALKTKSIAESKFWNVSISERNEMIFNETQDLSVDEIREESIKVFD